MLDCAGGCSDGDGVPGRTSASVAASLKQDVTSIVTAANASAKAGKLMAFTQLVQAQTGKSLTSTQAHTLITLADAL
jgi:hypothetical protein